MQKEIFGAIIQNQSTLFPMLYANYAADTKMPLREQFALLSVMVNSLYSAWNVTLTAQLDKPWRKCTRTLNDVFFPSFRRAFLLLSYHYI